MAFFRQKLGSLSFFTTNNHVIASLVLVLLWGLGFTLSMTLAKMISSSVSTSTLVFLRCFFGMLFFFPFALRVGLKGVHKDLTWFHLLRIVFVCLAMLCTYKAYRTLPISTASAIGYSGPLFTTTLAWMVLKEPVSFKKWIGIICGYLGVLIIVEPHSLVLNSYVGIAVLANILGSCAIITTKKLASSESAVITLFYTNVATCLFFAVPAVASWQMPCTKDLCLLLGVGFLGAMSQCCYFMALKGAPSSFVSSFEYTRLIFASLAGYLFFSEIPTGGLLLGALVIVCSNLYLVRLEIHASKKRIEKRE